MAAYESEGENHFRYVYGPVPSRRLGRSLGVDAIPFKTCTFDCVYCQLGRTTHKTIERKEYVSAEAVLDEVKRKLAEGDIPDYITFSGSGEPTLNSRIGDMIRGIKEMTDVPVAVLTNGSLLWRKEVQEELMAADLVIPSLDAGDEQLFQYVNRPHGDLSFERVVDGLIEFTRRFPGQVWLEILLLKGVTGLSSHVEKIVALAKRIAPARIQLNTVCRPPAEEFAFPLSTEEMLSLKELFPGRVEVILEDHSDRSEASAFSESREEDVLGLLRRRPCTSEDIAEGLGIHVTEALKRLNVLVDLGKVHSIVSGGRNFYIVTGSKSSLRSQEEGDQ
ncbi:Wyosine [tRNA(Phe)-imidazoG37] synthetase, radical SAM superfamily [Syntrophus gentianae]|uniref:Wyosine [tRNA(Phe)-imidazoG37] synthetase, radical SAM superfamily n=2 Tax=Syntrophus gentianae TaxID=43775 RepID=A0A1H7V4I8_9BACT|nr:Wyosine [tRNA(Phe)-imidazoG37] synthetase, radical SAM superfamily [Syntrophus gentianae]